MGWLPNFGDKDGATAAITLAIYSAGNAILNVGPAASDAKTGYPLLTSSGFSIQKPSITIAATIIVSLLLDVQITGLMLSTRVEA